MRDGLLMLQLMDAIKPGVVDWAKVTAKPKNVHAKIINCNYAVLLGKEAFGFSLVGIQGKVWMRGPSPSCPLSSPDDT